MLKNLYRLDCLMRHGPPMLGVIRAAEGRRAKFRVEACDESKTFYILERRPQDVEEIFNSSEVTNN